VVMPTRHDSATTILLKTAWGGRGRGARAGPSGGRAAARKACSGRGRGRGGSPYWRAPAPAGLAQSRRRRWRGAQRPGSTAARPAPGSSTCGQRRQRVRAVGKRAQMQGWQPLLDGRSCLAPGTSRSRAPPAPPHPPPPHTHHHPPEGRALVDVAHGDGGVQHAGGQRVALRRPGPHTGRQPACLPACLSPQAEALLQLPVAPGSMRDPQPPAAAPTVLCSSQKSRPAPDTSSAVASRKTRRALPPSRFTTLSGFVLSTPVTLSNTSLLRGGGKRGWPLKERSAATGCTPWIPCPWQHDVSHT
jgi:hypothetical protein